MKNIISLIGKSFKSVANDFKFEVIQVLNKPTPSLPNRFVFEWNAIDGSQHPPLQFTGVTPSNDLAAFNRDYVPYNRLSNSGGTYWGAGEGGIFGGGGTSDPYGGKIPLDIPKALGCDHEWKEYIGLFESYKYCKKCNKKEAHE